MKTLKITITKNADTYAEALTAAPWGEDYQPGFWYDSEAGRSKEVKEDGVVVEAHLVFKGETQQLATNVEWDVKRAIKALHEPVLSLTAPYNEEEAVALKERTEKAVEKAVGKAQKLLSVILKDSALASVTLTLDEDGNYAQQEEVEEVPEEDEDTNEAWDSFYDAERDNMEAGLNDILTSHALGVSRYAEGSRNKFFLNALQVQTLVQILTKQRDPWHVDSSDYSLHLFNAINMGYDWAQDDYVEDWNTSVRYHKDSGKWYNSLEAEFTITPLGVTLDYLFNKDGSFKPLTADEINEHELRFLVETPAGLSFQTMESYLVWILQSVEDCFGPQK